MLFPMRFHYVEYLKETDEGLYYLRDLSFINPKTIYPKDYFGPGDVQIKTLQAIGDRVDMNKVPSCIFAYFNYVFALMFGVVSLLSSINFLCINNNHYVFAYFVSITINI